MGKHDDQVRVTYGDGKTKDHPATGAGLGRPMKIIIGIGALAIGAAIFGALIGPDDPSAGSTSAGPRADASASLACPHFRNVARDASDGLYTDAELRQRLQEVERDARGSTVPGLSSAARRMLAAITASDDLAFGDAIEEFSGACGLVGL